MAKITVKTNDGQEDFQLGQTTSIGRHVSNDIGILDSVISKRHAHIVQTDEGFLFEDLGSSNGSFVSGIRIKKHLFHEGDILQLGKHTSIVFCDTDDGFDPLASRISISQFSSDNIKDRIDIESASEFLPEQRVYDDAMLRVDYEKLRMGYDLMTKIGLNVNLRIILEKMAGELLGMFTADRCVILLSDGKTGELSPRAIACSESASESVSVSASVLREVRESQSALLLTDTSLDERFSETSSIITQGIRSVMCAPIMHAGDFFGAIHMDSRHAQRSFTSKDLQLLIGIVGHVALAVVNARLMKSVEIETKTRSQFERLLSPAVVEQMISGGVSLDEPGEMREITVMFVDIRGFTSLSQRSSAITIVGMLNSYYEEVVKVIFAYGGTVDKYIGDEIMVLFGAPLDMENAADQAVSCALEIHQALDRYNLKREKIGQEPVRIGIGIDTGEGIIGSIGARETKQYTCIGNVVNIASRLTGIAEPGQIIISSVTHEHLKHRYQVTELPLIALKGIEKPVQSFAVCETLKLPEEVS
ncbi:MAG: adenylate/guanylate cyclase domain-containing protein, partial [Mariprofundaceae bacterium]